MTAHRQKPTITPERVAWFAIYYSQNPSWGIFHVCLDDGNWTIGASDHIWDAPPYTENELREAARWFNSLSPSQRRRLGSRAANLARRPL